ncbi:Xaa-Pro aminopeptidase [Haliangium ochraceum]|uniref:Xaa-Pro aminopeptidase n=1 Tax=Haliangium ochraceum (strain DSM 14365 / JCM 11303 / SMP-2) TaxID=502025 RepID=D0LJW8_HALO1|nr:Xaa-Pro aminopeptidase [Haliangium ochraceum]ACY18475.1 peptidase M24 [Haliangium ochraceum DSM 14365]
MSRVPSPTVVPAVFAARRVAYMQALGAGAVAVFHAAPEAPRGSVPTPYRQASDLYYLSGFGEPQATLVLRPGAERERVVLFVRPRDPQKEIWDGRRAGVEGALTRYGADAAYPCSELSRRLPELIAGCDSLHYSLGSDPAFDRRVGASIAALRRSERSGKAPPRSVVDPRTLLHEMRLHKTGEELELMRRAAALTTAAHREAMRVTEPGMFEYQLASLFEHSFRSAGGGGPGYSTIVGAGENATILHYTDNAARLDDGDLVLIDAGCEFEHYTADVTRTYPVSGRFSDAQRHCYEVVLRAQKSAVELVRPGANIDAIHEHVVEQLTAGMLELGLLSGTLEACIADESYKRFYMHRSSHWLGLDVHDVGDYRRDGVCRPLSPGMVLTVEPGLYIAADAEGVPDQYRGIGIRIEDDILVTADGHENLTADAPKEIAEIEAACR